MHNIAMCYAQLEMHEEAISWFEKALKLYETEFGRDHEKTISALMHVARQYFACDMFDEAIGHYRRMLTTKEQILPDSDETVILLIFQLFPCTSKSGQNEKAMVWGRRFVAVGETSDLEKRLIVKKGMGNIHAKNKQHSEALDLYLEVLSDTKFLDQDHWLHRLHSSVVYDIHRLYAEMDGDNEAIQDLQRQREMISQVLDSDPRAGAILLHQLGHVYARQRMQHEALSLLEEALEAIQCLPPDSELISLKRNAISGIADAHLKLYNNQAALTYLRILVDSEEDAGWKAGAMIRMAGALEQGGEFEQAIELWKQVRREEERKSGVDTIDVLCTARKIGSLYLRIGNTKEALRWTEGTLAGLRRCNDPEARLQEMRTLGLMSSLHWELGDLNNALSTQRTCVTGLEVTLGESDKQTLGAYFDREICNTLGEVVFIASNSS
ncbi:TPR-like protein [Trematosphaeria pertusa]|uniref:TPR-like protein n=1 Tax=Trematosphaeria pertusa TaxID=390896 RepID=A0A6A6IP24_9PLEO|nr:TPR-like protein [Trematosphaeria pertusa]KAF2251582.1 TPR-like protein [Trematosphaeria pertusa]